MAPVFGSLVCVSIGAAEVLVDVCSPLAIVAGCPRNVALLFVSELADATSMAASAAFGDETILVPVCMEVTVTVDPDSDETSVTVTWVV